MESALTAAAPQGSVLVECDAYPCVGLMMTSEDPGPLVPHAREGRRYQRIGVPGIDPRGEPVYFTGVYEIVDDVAGDDASPYGRAMRLIVEHLGMPDRVAPDDPRTLDAMDW